MNKVIGIIGTRRRDTFIDFDMVYNAFKKYYNNGDCICSGKCSQGGDRFAVIIADRLGLSKDKRMWYPANWNKYGKSAGMIRNTYIAKDSDILIACVAGDRRGGTEDTIRKFVKMYGERNLVIV